MQKTLHKFTWLVLVLSVAFCSCNDDNTPLGGSTESEWSQPVTYKNANLVYYGSDDGIDISSYFKLTLYTDMELDPNSNPVGPGQILRLSINASLFDGKAEGGYQLPAGKYQEAVSAHDFQPFSFNAGFLVSLDLPDGRIETPDGSFYGDISQGVTQFDADLLSDGMFEVVYDGAGNCVITGMAAGAACEKRKFSYKGPIEVIDRSSPIDETPNTTLTADLELKNLKHARLFDMDDYFKLENESCRVFELRLCSEGFDLGPMWPTGSGEMLKITMLVAWGADVTQGIPEGVYDFVPRESNSGILRENLVPGKILSGYPNKFEYPEGTWYQLFANDKLTEYARITEGSMTITRNGDAHTITFGFIDCNTDKPHKIKGTYTQQIPIEVYKFQI